MIKKKILCGKVLSNEKIAFAGEDFKLHVFDSKFNKIFSEEISKTFINCMELVN